MNTLFSAGWGLWQTKPLVRVSPQPCPAAERAHTVSQGRSISLGTAWAWAGTVTLGINPVPSAAGTGIPPPLQNQAPQQG